MVLENHYTYRTEWSEEDGCYIARVLEFPSLSAFGDTRIDAESELTNVIKDVLVWMGEENELIPEPVSHKEFKGNISLRIPPETHRNVVMMALNEGVSINQYITSLIERNLYCDSISFLINSFDRKLQVYNENFQKMTLVNLELYNRMTQLTNNSFMQQGEQGLNIDYTQSFIPKNEGMQITI